MNERSGAPRHPDSRHAGQNPKEYGQNPGDHAVFGMADAFRMRQDTDAVRHIEKKQSHPVFHLGAPLTVFGSMKKVTMIRTSESLNIQHLDTFFKQRGDFHDEFLQSGEEFRPPVLEFIALCAAAICRILQYGRLSVVKVL